MHTQQFTFLVFILSESLVRLLFNQNKCINFTVYMSHDGKVVQILNEQMGAEFNFFIPWYSAHQ